MSFNLAPGVSRAHRHLTLAVLVVAATPSLAMPITGQAYEPPLGDVADAA